MGSLKIYHHSFTRILILGVILSLSGLVGYSQTKDQIFNLQPAQKSVVNSSKFTTYHLKLSASKQNVISLEIKQNAMDVRVKLFSPNNVLLAETDQPFSEQDTEIVFVVANEDGKYLLEITSKFPEDKGSINIKSGKIREATSTDVKHAEAEKLFSEAQTLRKTGSTANRQKSIEVFDKSLLIWREIDDKFGEIRTLANLAYLHRMLGSFKKSAEFSNQIAQFPDTEQFIPYKYDSMYQTAQIHFLNGRFDEALKTHKSSLAYLKKPSPQQANTFGAMGNIYQFIFEFELSQKVFAEALNNVKQFPDMYNEAQIRHNLGLLFITLKDWDLAISHLKMAATLREKFGNRRGQASSLSLIGLCNYYKKDFPASFEFLNKSLPISQELGDVENQSDTLSFLAVNYRETGNAQKAVEMLNRAVALHSDKNSLLLNTPYITLGVTHTELRNFAEARGYFERALKGYRRNGDLDGETRSLYQFAKLERAENNLEAAKLKVEKALQNHEYIQAKFKNTRHLSSILEVRRGYFDLYIDILMRLEAQRPNENFALKALQVNEGARMRTLIWQLREAFKDSPQSVEYQLITNLQKVQQQIGEQLSLLAKAQSNPNQNAKIAEIEKTISELNRQDDSLKAQFRQSNPNIANLTQPPTLSLEQLQAELDDESVLVEYTLGEQRSFLWIVSKNSFQSFTLPKRAEIDAQAKKFYEMLNQSVEGENNRLTDKKTETKKVKTKDLHEEANKLSQMLLVEKFAETPAKRLVFVTDGALNLIPFASLPISKSNQKYLSDKFEMVQVPSLTTLHILRERNIKPFAPHSLAVIADPVFSATDERLAKSKRSKTKAISDETLTATLRDFSLTSLARLPFSRLEAEKISDNSLNNTSLNLGFKANRERVLDGDFDHYDILHFATHGFLNNNHPELSGLVLSLVDEKGNQQNGFLRTQDLYLLKIKPQMVVLSACQTGLGKQVENEGLVGLTRGFLANGTPRIIATLWKVDDSVTAEFMSRFYRALLKENQKPSAALKTAQNELKAIPRYAHPRHWAGFVLTGEWR